MKKLKYDYYKNEESYKRWLLEIKLYQKLSGKSVWRNFLIIELKHQTRQVVFKTSCTLESPGYLRQCEAEASQFLRRVVLMLLHLQSSGELEATE